jgi:hypothetical protein
MRTDRQTDMTKLTVPFRNFANATKSQSPTPDPYQSLILPNLHNQGLMQFIGPSCQWNESIFVPMEAGETKSLNNLAAKHKEGKLAYGQKGTVCSFLWPIRSLFIRKGKR